MSEKIPVFPDFTELTIGHRQAVEEALSTRNPRISEHCFTEMTMWAKSRNIKLSYCDGSLIVMGDKDDFRFFHPPAGGSNPAAAARKVMKHFKRGAKDQHLRAAG